MNNVRLANAFDMLRWKLVERTSSSIMKCYLSLLGVPAPGAKFYGLAKIKRAPGASITFGNQNVFRSLSTSNLIGVNRPCIMSATKEGALLKTGTDCGFSGTVIGCFVSVTLGDHVRCGANTLITDSDWHTDDPRSKGMAPVVIEDNVWLGEGVKVLKGVTIGANTLIGAGSVVVNDIPAGVVAAGNPCKTIRSLDSETTGDA